MQKIKAALISVFYKDGLESLVKTLSDQGIQIYSTGGTQKFIEGLGISCISAESVTGYPSILGGRVKTLHPKIFGGILARRELDSDMQEVKAFELPQIDLVITNLYPFEETVKATNEEAKIIEKIDIGGPSMIRAAAKNYKDVAVIASPDDYELVNTWLKEQNGALSREQRRELAGKAFRVTMNYDIAINNYFNGTVIPSLIHATTLRYGENPHQKGVFYGDMSERFEKLNGKAISYNNLVDIEAALNLIRDFEQEKEVVFAIFKHTNVCGIAVRPQLEAAWTDALAGDPESAFGGILITNTTIDESVAKAISARFYEVLIAPDFTPEALSILKESKNRILLKLKSNPVVGTTFKNIMDGILVQDIDQGNYDGWDEVGAKPSTEAQKEDLIFGNLVCKHLKSNAIAIVKNRQLLGKGCGQTSRIDALRHAVDKAKQFDFDLEGAVLASDAFFPFDDCVRMADEEGITAVIQPGGSIRDKDSITYCQQHDMVMVMTGQRHFRH